MKQSTSLRPAAPFAVVLLAALSLAGCASSGGSGGSAPAPKMSMTPPSPDPRVGLAPGWWNAAEASWNVKLVSNTHPSADFTNPSTPGDGRLTNSDLAFLGNYVFQGNYSGYQVWDITNPAKPTLRTAFVCPGSQSDVTVFKNLLFVSAEATSGRTDCGMQGVADTVSHDRARGIRIFDITDIANPKPLVTVQTCRGSHTNTLVMDPKDKENVYIYVSGSAGVRSPNELSGCSDGDPRVNPNSALFRIEVIGVPLAHPEQAKIVSSPRIFNDLTAAVRHADNPEDLAAASARAASRNAPGQPSGRPAAETGPTQCHDITAYPEIGLAGGACRGYGILLDIRDVANPRRIAAVADSNFAAWHSVTFNNDGTAVLFSDEWGGGSAPRCRATDKHEWGADALFTLKGNVMTFKSYYKMSAPQTPFENCVAHNGTLIPIPGRDVMVQSWYQGGISIFDWTDTANPKEIAYFDRGPMDGTKLVNGGHWSAYWYNGYVYGSEISRGLDVWELVPSAFLSRSEIDAARSVKFDHFNAQGQPKFVWPASFSMPRSFLDQLERNGGLAADKISATRAELTRAEKMSGQGRKDALSALATKLHGDARGAADEPRAHKLASSVGDLAKATS